MTMSWFISSTRRTVQRLSSRPRQSLFSPQWPRNKSTPTSIASKTVAKEDSTAISKAKTPTLPPLWQRLGPISGAANAYAHAQKKRPYVTQFVSTIVIYLTGDLAAQKIGNEDYNPWRSARSILIGSLISIPSYRWFIYLGTCFNYPSKALSLGAKVLVNQVLFTPLFACYFFGMQSLLSGNDIPATLERLKNTVPPSLLNSCLFWPAVTAVSFTFIHPEYRSVFAGFIAIFWQSYLSWLNQHAATKEKALRGERATKLLPGVPLKA